jgi:glutathione S-transferase
MTLELHQFPFSHYNEKARWALDWKGVPHVRESYLPGPHVPFVFWLSGQRTVPVLRAGPETVCGSAPIIEWLERTHPEPPLLPSAPAARTEALEIQRWFDEKVGPAVRRAFFFDFLIDGDYAARCLAHGKGGLKTALYRATFPATRAIMRLDMGVNADGAERARERTAEALDRVAKTAGPDDYLVGDRFSVADLAAAALLSPVAFPRESPVWVAEPHSNALRTWLARWADHPGTAWVRRTFARHRGRSAEIAHVRR